MLLCSIVDFRGFTLLKRYSFLRSISLLRLFLGYLYEKMLDCYPPICQYYRIDICFLLTERTFRESLFCASSKLQAQVFQFALCAPAGWSLCTALWC